METVGAGGRIKPARASQVKGSWDSELNELYGHSSSGLMTTSVGVRW